MAPARDDELFTPAAACRNPTSLKPDGAEGRLMHRSLVQHPSMVESASGVYLNLANGRKVIDACGGAAVAIIGHGNEEVIQAIADQARKTLEALLRAELTGCRSVGDIRGRGLFWGVEFVGDRDTRETFDPKTGFGIRVQERAFEKGVALYPGAGTVDGTRGDHVLLAPPYTATEEELRVICRVLREAVEEIEAETL
ncbi:putative aminotransferase [Colletotrichum tanaceti]|uniref:Putative aminotransferase n=1 Tax=Colletotrichum tanaceti TaxID=1306861 RepID=A0A4U6X5Q7_9PEZI|nr:putative aminotransferase [Colletotrichum tanaceti]TKW50169.1 putative aminotransferase [Colletotrichum tanaceti]